MTALDSQSPQSPESLAARVDNPDRARLRVLHVSATFTAGVYEAVRQYIDSSPDVEHHLLVEARSDSSYPPAVSTRLLRQGKLKQLADVRRAIVDVRPDVVHAHSSWAGLWTRLQRRGPAVVYQPHALASEGHSSGRAAQHLYAAVERALACRTAGFIALSPRERALLQDIGRGRPVFQLHNMAVLPLEHERTWRPDGAPTIGTVGRISAQKDPDYFLSLVDATRQLMPQLRAVWIGDGDPDLRRLLESHGVVVTGWMSHDEVARALTRLSIYVHTARYEGFPLSVLDAGLVGVPVAVRAAAWTQEIALATFDTADAGAEICIRAIADETYRQELVDLSSDLTQLHSPARQAADLQGTYQRVARSQTRSSNHA